MADVLNLNATSELLGSPASTVTSSATLPTTSSDLTSTTSTSRESFASEVNPSSRDPRVSNINGTIPASVPTTDSGTPTTAKLTSTTAAGVGSPTASSSSSSSGGGGLDTGAKVGIAVGVVAVVLALAGFLLWRFYARRKNSRHAPGRHDPSAYGNVKHVPGTGGNPNSNITNTANIAEKGGISAAAAPLLRQNTDPPSAASSPDGSLGGAGALALPQQADDATVQSKFSTLFDQIELHAENFYKDASPIIPPAIEGALSRYDTPLLGAPLAARLEQSPRATTILKHVLAYEIVVTTLTAGKRDGTSASGGTKKRSLLPQPLLALLQDLDKQRPAGSGSVRRTTSPINKTTLTQLKNLAHTYYTSPETIPSTTTGTTTTSSPSTTTATSAAQNFTQIFSLWADPAHDESRRAAHLADLFDNAVKFTFWLLRQPETFEVRWEGGGASAGAGDESSSSGADGATGGAGNNSSSGSLVTVPALVKVTRNGGTVRLSRSEEKVISRAVYRRV